MPVKLVELTPPPPLQQEVMWSRLGSVYNDVSLSDQAAYVR